MGQPLIKSEARLLELWLDDGNGNDLDGINNDGNFRDRKDEVTSVEW